MTRNQKHELVEKLSAEFEGAGAVIACDYRGMSVQELEDLRHFAADKDVKVHVVKNTLASLALQKTGTNVESLKGTNIFIWSEDQIAAAKVYAHGAKIRESFEISCAVVEKSITDAQTVQALSKLPGREELLGMLLSVWTAPARNFVTGLDNLRAKKEDEQ